MSQNTTAMQRGAGGETTGATDMTTQQPGFSMSQYASSTDLFAAMIARITDLEAQLEAIGAGGVSGPLIGQPQAMPDLSQLTERGAKAWAGVDAQGLREGFTAADMATAEARGFRDGAASAMAGEPMAWMTFTEEGDPDMVFLDRLEACQYCEDDDPPKPLYLAAPPTAQAEGWTKLPGQLPEPGTPRAAGHWQEVPDPRDVGGKAHRTGSR